LDAVETAVRALEDDPTFDAGHGSVLNARGHIEMDAIIMDGRDLNLGAVMAVRTVRHPITLARLVMAESEHAILAGEGAEAFARERGIAFCPSWELVVDREAERWRAHRSQARRSEDLFEQRLAASHPCGTVGAVTIDGHGHLAAATSTGGKFSKHPGRVGDSPLVGCGAYADDRSGAVSATGDGEQLMKILISKSACDFLLSGMTAQAAADACISLLAKRTGGRGGVIVLGKQGDIGIAHNTSHLVYAHVTGEAGITSRVSSISDA
jgi:beta-aspartyl-peptidase (threonine type)